MKPSFLALVCSALVACGGSGSETPPPVEPTTNWQDEEKQDQNKQDQNEEQPAEADEAPSQPAAPIEPTPDEESAE